MKVGFTGTRQGMTEEQKQSLRHLLLILKEDQEEPGLEFHHGDCIGADAEAHDIARELGYRIIGHPPKDPTHRAFKECDELHEEKTHFARNREIVWSTRVLIGASLTPFRTERGGTWYTIDYARKQHHCNVVIWPDGSTEEGLCSFK